MSGLTKECNVNKPRPYMWIVSKLYIYMYMYQKFHENSNIKKKKTLYNHIHIVARYMFFFQQSPQLPSRSPQQCPVPSCQMWQNTRRWFPFHFAQHLVIRNLPPKKRLWNFNTTMAGISLNLGSRNKQFLTILNWYSTLEMGHFLTHILPRNIHRLVVSRPVVFESFM